MYRQSEKNMLNSNICSTRSHNMVSFGPLAAEICLPVWGTPANFDRFCVLASLLQRRSSTEVNQTLHDVWPSLGVVHYIYIFGGPCPWRNFARCKVRFTSKSCVLIYWQHYCTALHSSSRRQPNFAAWYTEWNHGTFTEGATYIWLGGHQVGHRTTF